jgi:uncharacterized protein YcfJ/predicted small lipoprotein YifL
MNTYTMLSKITLAAALAGALAGCGDKPPTANADATANAPADAAAAPAQQPPPPASGQGLTAREMISAPRGSVPAAQDAHGDAAPDAEAPPPGTARANADAESPTPRTPIAGRAEPSAPPDDASHGAGARYANVISVQPVKQKATREREECRDERIVHKRRPKDDHQVAGTVIGALAGGVIGHQVGGGRGRDLATVAGAVGGGYAGKKIQQGQQDRDTYTTTERRCRTVSEPVDDVAYDVVYEYLGQTHQVRLDHDPGERLELPVRGVE